MEQPDTVARGERGGQPPLERALVVDALLWG